MKTAMAAKKSSSSAVPHSTLQSSNYNSQPVTIVEEYVRRGNETICRKYIKGKLLGKGGFAKCYEFTLMDTGRLYAGKIIEKSTLTKPKTKQKLMSEIKIHNSLSHPHIVKFERYFEDKYNVYILLEVCRRNTLMELVKEKKRLTETEAKYFMAQILIATKYMHENRIIHRDLKLGNLFLNDDMHIKIGDFGLAAQLEHDGERKTTICGTPNYIAPEILEGREGHSYEVDIWSLGVILYTLIVGKPPFETPNINTTYKKIKANAYRFPEGLLISEQVRTLIQSILQSCPQKRPTVGDILKDPWFIGTPTVCPPSLLSSGPSSSENDVPSLRSKHVYPSATQPTNTVRQTIGGVRQPLSSIPVSLNVPSLTANTNTNLMAPPLTEAKENANTLQFARMKISSTPQTTATPPTAAPAPLSAYPHLQHLQPAVPQYYPQYAQQQQHHHQQMAATGSPMVYSPTQMVVTPPIAAPVSMVSPPSVATPPTASTMTPNSATTVKSSSSSSSRTTANEEREDEDDANNLTTMHHNLTRSFAHPDPRSAPQSIAAPRPVAAVATEEVLKGPNVWVKQWADFSNKYGLAYKLSNGITGAYFNDSTKIVWNSSNGQIDYYERIRTKTGSVDEKSTFSYNSYPQTLHKKVTLVRYFKSYLENAKKEGEIQCGGSANGDPADDMFLMMEAANNNTGGVYIKRWLRTKHAIIFRLSNKDVQVWFFDRTEIILSSEARIVTYTNHDGERTTYSLDSIVSRPAPDVAKRLKYTKDILYQLISINGNNGAANGQSPASSSSGSSSSGTPNSNRS